MGRSCHLVEDTLTVQIDGKKHRFVCPVEASAARLVEIDRQLRLLLDQRIAAAADLEQQRGIRAYREAARITVDNTGLTER